VLRYNGIWYAKLPRHPGGGARWIEVASLEMGLTFLRYVYIRDGGPHDDLD
jgi:hypothetical protein